MEVWIGRDGERHGPYQEEDVRQWLRSGQVSPDDLGWYDGLADWQPLSVLFPGEAVAQPPEAPAATAPLPQTSAPALEDYAGFWKRVLAYILDSIILYIPSLLIQKAMGGDAAKEVMVHAITNAGGNIEAIHAAQLQYYTAIWPAMLLGGILAWLYFAICESSPWQATIGKLALGIRVTDLRGARISFPRALGRYAAKIVSFAVVFIGVLMVAFTRRKQGLHDLMANTLVLNGRAGEFRDAPPKSPAGGGSFNA